MRGIYRTQDLLRALTRQWHGELKAKTTCSCLLFKSFRQFSEQTGRTISPLRDAREQIQRKPKTNRLDVAIVGMPNAGKSQLLNVMTKTPGLAAVSRKRHTTRTGIMGVRTFEEGDEMLQSTKQPPTQLLFVDTPGFLKLQNAKQEALFTSLVMAAQQDVKTSDIALLVVDSVKSITPNVRSTYASLMLVACCSHVENQIAGVFTPKVPLAIVLNKVDLVSPKGKLIELAHELGYLAEECWSRAEAIVLRDTEADRQRDEQEFLLQVQEGNVIPVDQREHDRSLIEQQVIEKTNIDSPENKDDVFPIKEREDYCPVFMVSALHDDGGVDDILKFLIQKSQAGEWEFDPSESTQTPQERVMEIIREKIYRSVHKEVPHQVTQVNRRFEYFAVPPDMKDQVKQDKIMHYHDTSKVLRVEQELLVLTKSHSRILLGNNGATLQRIQQQAQYDMEVAFNCRVFLELKVKIRKNSNLRSQNQGSFQDDSELDQ